MVRVSDYGPPKKHSNSPRIGLELFLGEEPNVSLEAMEGMDIRKPLCGAFSVDRILEIIANAGIYGTMEAAESQIHSILHSVQIDKENKYKFVPLNIGGQVKGYYLAEAVKGDGKGDADPLE